MKMTPTSFWTKLLDLFAPRLCVACQRRLSAGERVVCADCLHHLPLTLFSRNAYDNPMARLFWGLFPVERATAWFFYEAGTETANMVHAMKYYGREDVAEELGRMAATDWQADDFFDGIDCIVPVPLSKDRQRQRGYNQSALIAKGMALTTGLPVREEVLKRHSFHESQTHLTALERRENVDQAFSLDRAEGLEGKHLLLVDDVLTTGSTLIACAQQLVQIPQVRISVASLGMTKS